MEIIELNKYQVLFVINYNTALCTPAPAAAGSYIIFKP